MDLCMLRMCHGWYVLLALLQQRRRPSATILKHKHPKEGYSTLLHGARKQNFQPMTSTLLSRSWAKCCQATKFVGLCTRSSTRASVVSAEHGSGMVEMVRLEPNAC